MAQRADKPLKIDLSFEDALEHILKAKPVKTAPKASRKGDGRPWCA